MKRSAIQVRQGDRRAPNRDSGTRKFLMETIGFPH